MKQFFNTCWLKIHVQTFAESPRLKFRGKKCASLENEETWKRLQVFIWVICTHTHTQVVFGGFWGRLLSHSVCPPHINTFRSMKWVWLWEECWFWKVERSPPDSNIEKIWWEVVSDVVRWGINTLYPTFYQHAIWIYVCESGQFHQGVVFVFLCIDEFSLFRLILPTMWTAL